MSLKVLDYDIIIHHPLDPTHESIAHIFSTIAESQLAGIVLLRLMRVMKSLRAMRMVRSLHIFRGLRFLAMTDCHGSHEPRHHEQLFGAEIKHPYVYIVYLITKKC